MPSNVLEYLENSCEKYPDKIAVQDENVSIPYARMMEQAKQIGSLIARHAQPVQPVMILINRSALTPVAYWGVLYAGCFYIPVDMNTPAERVQYLIDFVKPAVILAVEDRSGILDAIQYTGPVFNMEDAAAEPINVDELKLRVSRILDIDPMCVMFTSGSTGTPKGVVLQHRASISRAEANIDMMRIGVTDICGILYPLYNTVMMRELCSVLCASATMHIVPQNVMYNPVILFQYINRYSISILNIPATSFTYCAKADVFSKASLTTVKTVGFGGSAVDLKALNMWIRNLPEALFIHRFGSTEMGTTSIFIPKPGTEIDVLPLGEPCPNSDVILLDGDDRPVKDGETGEICVKSSSMAAGYYNDPVLTAEKFVQNPLNTAYLETIFRTGDLGVFDEKGNLFFRGRKDRQVKCKGYLVKLDEIESVARTMPEIVDCRSLYHKDEDKLYLFYSGTATTGNIRLYIRQKLPTYMIPHKFVRLETIPLINSVKADYERLKEIMYEGQV